MPEWIGKTVGKVRIEKALAQGGMAEVYLGTHLTLDRAVAVKVMHNYIEADPDLQSRFEREAKVVAALRHPNIVQIFDFDTADGHPYIVMEYLKGPTLAIYLRELSKRNARLQPVQIARLLITLAAALDYAHEQGVVHRDIKPGNIILHNKAREFSSEEPLTEQTEPVITDFGLVRIAHSTTQTASGVVSGTPAYMSPEQAQGAKVDHRSDIYSLGIVLYELLAGRVPFDADTSWSVILKHINEPPPPISGVQPPVQKVIERVLAKEPEQRYQTCRELTVDYMDAIGMVSESETLRLKFPSTPSTARRPTADAPQAFDDAFGSASTQGRPATASEKRDQPARPTWRRILPFAGLGIIVLMLAGIGFQRLTQFTSSTDAQTSTAVPIENASGPIGLLRFQDGTAPADKVTITTTGMPLPPQGTQYQAWLIEDDGEQRIGIGLINFDQDNKGSLTFTDKEGRNLVGQYHALEITVEPAPDNNPIPSNDVAFSVILPLNGYKHVRHLLFSYGATPNKTSLIGGIDADTELISQSATEMLAAFESGDGATVGLQAEKMLNIITGNQSDDYKDWNNDGNTDDPSDGFGLLLNGDNEGYIQGTFSHAGFAATAEDATKNMMIHGEHVRIAVTNIGEWTPLLRDQLRTILGSTFGPDIESPIRQAVALANQIRNGIDIDGNESIEPIPGEGGAKTAYEHAYYMADMSIFAGETQPPTP